MRVVKSEILKARNGQLTVQVTLADGSRRFLSSSYDPSDEAVRWAENVQHGSNDVIILFGLGAGYHAEALLLNLGPSNRLLVIEPIEDIPATASTRRVERHPSARVVSGMEELWRTYETIENNCWRRIHLYSVPSYRSLFETEYLELERLVSRRINALSLLRSTVFNSARIWQNNLFGNLIHLMSSGSVASVFESFRGRPAIIVSAGPSLNKNVHLLGRAGNRALIIATGTAARLLSIRKVPYHLVVTVDPNHTNFFAHFENISHEHATLVYDAVTYPQVVATHRGPQAAFFSLPDCRWIERYTTTPFGLLKTGGSVSNIAFDLARRIGADPIILIGQDLAFVGGLSNAEGTYREDFPLDIPPELIELSNSELRTASQANERLRFLTGQGRLQVPGIDGQPVWTDRKLYGFLSWFEEEIANLKGSPKVIDATEGGALIRGADLLTLERTLARHCPTELEGEITRFLKALGTPAQFSGSDLLADLKRVHTGLSEFREESLSILLGLRIQEDSVGIAGIETETAERIEKLKFDLHFALTPFLVRLFDLQSASAQDWRAARRAFYEDLYAALDESLSHLNSAMNSVAERLVDSTGA